MTGLLNIINSKEKSLIEKVKDLKEYLNNNSEIVINKVLFINAIIHRVPAKGGFINGQEAEIVYPILHYCIEHNSAKSEKGEILSFQNVMNILDKTVHEFVTPEYFYGLINFQDQNGNTLLHQAVISNNTEAIKALVKYGANPLIKDRNDHIPLDLAQGDAKKVLIKCMKAQAQSKKESARCNSLCGIIPGVFLGVGMGVSSALIPSMTIILCALAVSAFVVGVATGFAIYFLSQDYKQATLIEKAVNPQLSSVEYEKAYQNEATLKAE